LSKFSGLYPVRNNAPLLCRGLRSNKIPAGVNAPLEFLTEFTFLDGGIKKFIQINETCIISVRYFVIPARYPVVESNRQVRDKLQRESREAESTGFLSAQE
jgi:hypothetical protein